MAKNIYAGVKCTNLWLSVFRLIMLQGRIPWPTSTLDTFPNMRSKPLDEIIPEQAEDKRSGKGKAGRVTAEVKLKRGQLIPDYDKLADWRGIESVLIESRQDPAIPADLPGSLPQGEFPITPDDKPMLGLSPLEMIARNNHHVIVKSLEEAIISAKAALRPHLDWIAMDEIRHAYQSTKEARSAETAYQDTKEARSAETAYQGTKKARSAETTNQYRDAVVMQTNLYLAQKGGKDVGDINWPAFAEWFLSRKFDAKLKSSSWMFYRTAIIAHLERIPDDEAIYALAVLSTEDEGSYVPSGRKRTENLKVKKFCPDDFDRAIYYCHCRKSDSCISLLTYLRANIRVGLRPIEFLTSEIRMIPDSNAPYGRQVWMFVCTAKYSNGRANGPIRSLDLSAMDASAIEVIRKCIDDARFVSQMHGYRRWLNRLNSTLHNVYKSSNSKMSDHYTAYSVRHQAIANWKSMYDPVTVAALAGHATPSAAITHYGKVRDAWRRERMENMIVRPSSADIARMRNRMLMAKERHKPTTTQQPIMGF